MPYNSPMDKEANRIIDDLGGTNAVARMFDIEPPSVSDWRKTGIPKARLMYLKLARPDLFVVPKRRKAQVTRKAA